MLRTKRLKIRRIKESDLFDLQDYATQKKVAQEAEFTLCKTLDDVRAFYRILDNEHTWVIEYSAEKKVIGNICLYEQIGEQSQPIEDRRVVGYALNQDYWGQGIMTEALAAMVGWAQENGIKEVTGMVSDRNVASQRVLEKNGFVLVVKRKANPFFGHTSAKQVYTYCRLFN
ncbi:ribosomal-protein-S5p-alanine acetyltransferase [Liquorilactobacillus sucicola DSM 21376 = JCM 15457]|uniref:N-acetyltransferase domain-containing protein n=1 Tax=Liquorilactobacillus sucicola DSM 21376 = JCM 15457 TaxID=1423806 RepID=A0A023CYF5_9LACO|nr:GNAT family N-acetyltransferase [Liquorilactobacillus sucicola]KRN07459.1 hypothetical protein FD15_GL000738 [Liquorilactobacillus sucicola DSM 21376 = JCM 15457]GAJ26917.1 ribosomal-protein-S5p-alanine acetyltransferase [Liquorilactobacillus sucicola DSM 21376 = JCM 15457]